MKLREIAEAYRDGELSKDKARELIHELDLPKYDVSWEGEHLLSGDPESDNDILSSMWFANELTWEQYDELLKLFPEGYKRELDPQDRTLYKQMTGRN